MNGRIKPRFEDLAYAADSKPNLKPPPPLITAPNDHEQAIVDFRQMSQDIKNKQYDAGAMIAAAERIAR